MRILAHHYLLERLSPSHPIYSIVSENLRLLEAGQRGEERLLKHLQSQENGIALHNVCLGLGEEQVQIDCLFITSTCCLVLESKNISGDLYFDPDTDEFFRLNPDQSKTFFSHPYYQLTRHIRFMDKWLKHHRLHLPVNGAVFFTSKSVTLRNNPFKRPFYKIESIHERLNFFQRLYQKEQLSDSQIQYLINQLSLLHRPYSQPGLLDSYNLTTADIITGIVCPSCGVSSLSRVNLSWNCVHCRLKTKKGLQQAVEQYLYIVKPNITNKEFRDFFGIESMETANKMLNQLKLKKHGGKKNHFYSLIDNT